MLNQIFKAARAYAIRLTDGLSLSHLAALEYPQLVMPGPLVPASVGWVGQARQIGDYVFLRLAIAERVLPASVVRRAQQERIEAVEREAGKALTEPDLRALKNTVFVELMAKAFVKVGHVNGYVDLRRELLVVGTGSAIASDEFTSALLRVAPEHIRIRQHVIHTEELGNDAYIARPPHETLKALLLFNEEPEATGLVFDTEFNLEKSDGATARFRGEATDNEAVKRLILEEGAMVTAGRLISADAGNDPIISSFIEVGAKQQLVFKSIRFEEFAQPHVADQLPDEEDSTPELEEQATLLINAQLFGMHFDGVASAFGLHADFSDEPAPAAEQAAA